MLRFTLMTLALIGTLAGTNARGQSADEVKRLKARVELLESKLETANLKIEKLQAEIEKLKAAESEAPAAKSDPLEEGTKWKGIATVNDARMTAEVSVVERTEKTAKVSIRYENGALWAFDCKTSGHSLTIKGAERLKATDLNAGKVGLPPAGGARGGGNEVKGKFTLNYSVPPAGGQDGVEVRVVADRQK